MPPTQGDTSASERIAAAFSNLSESAKAINDVSERLNKQIATLESALKRIHVGVACWTEIAKGGGQYHRWGHYVGYTLIRDEWRIAISETESNDWDDPEDPPKDKEWAFADAPRYLQPKAVEKLPDLIEALVAATDAAAKRLEDKVAPAEELASVVWQIAHPTKRK